MKDNYIVESEYRNNGKVALFLNKKRPYNRYKTMVFSIGNEKFDYELTHSENIIVTISDRSFAGKTIYFE